MAMMMSLNESMFQLVPGAGILLGGALTALFNPRVALWVGGAGSLLVTAAIWVALRPTAMRPIFTETTSGREGTGASGAPASATRHQ
jgi:predicted MFS family arabinose efflux permease